MPPDRSITPMLESCKSVPTEGKSRGVRGASVVLALLMAGCAVGPDFARPVPPSVGRYTERAEPAMTVAADGLAQRFTKGAKVVADWWRLFGSDQLNSCVQEAVLHNQSLQAAQASLRQSQDNLRAGYGVFFPQFDAAFDATRQKSAPARFGSGFPSTIFNLFTLSASVSYALDIFGGERRAVENLQAEADVQQALTLGTYLTLTGNVVNTVIAQAAYREEIKATEEIIALEKEQVKITEARARAGIARYSDVLSLRSQLAATEATLPPLKQKLSQADHLLATLAGRAPAEWRTPRIDLAELALPPELPISLPSDLVRQRPDILAAEAQLHSASANVGVATAALFPSFTLNGSYGRSNTSVEHLFSGTFWSVGGNVTAPLFHGGTLWFQREAALEGFQQSLANYRQTVLSSFAQVADTLQSLENDAEAVRAHAEAMSAADQALRLVQANYQAGTVNYLEILIANAQYHQTRIGYLQAKAQRLQDTVALFVVLGGSWQGEGSN